MLGFVRLARWLLQRLWFSFLFALLSLQRSVLPIKAVGLVFLLYPCVVTGFGFDPVWIVVYVVMTIVIGCLFAVFRVVLDKIRLPNPSAAQSSSQEEQQVYGQCERMIAPVRSRPWLFLLIPGEDGVFFLPLLYLGITPLTAAIAATAFTLIHYCCKPNSTLPGTFTLTFANIIVVLPHGILPMVVGHLLLDAVAFGGIYYHLKQINEGPRMV